MALNTTALIQSINDAFDFESEKDVTPAEARKRLATKIGNAVLAFVISGEVKTVVTGASATGGAVNGTGTGKLS